MSQLKTVVVTVNPIEERHDPKRGQRELRRSCEAVRFTAASIQKSGMTGVMALAENDVAIVELANSLDQQASWNSFKALNFIHVNSSIPVVAVRNTKRASRDVENFLADNNIPVVKGDFDFAHSRGDVSHPKRKSAPPVTKPGLFAIMREIAFDVPRFRVDTPTYRSYPSASFDAAAKSLTMHGVHGDFTATLQPQTAKLVALLADGKFYGNHVVIRGIKGEGFDGEIGPSDLKLLDVQINKLHNKLSEAVGEALEHPPITRVHSSGIYWSGPPLV